MLVPISDFNTAVPPFLSSPFFLFSSPFLFLFFFLLLVAPEKNRHVFALFGGAAYRSASVNDTLRRDN